MDFLNEFSAGLSGAVWGWPEVFPALVALLLVTGLIMTTTLRFIQMRRLKHSFDVIRGKYDDPSHDGDLSHFQALTTALSATVGIGNIAGVATALHYGGPGALFWMWVTAVFGMALKYAECTLAIKYRVILPNGHASGGPMYYIEKGLGSGWKWLAVMFAVCAIISSFGSGNSIQAFTVADQIRADLGVPTWITGLLSAGIVASVILGGIKRIGTVTSKLVPYMAVIYVAGGLTVLVMNIGSIPGVLADIFSSAFRPAAQLGGFAGGSFIFMLTWGVKRGLFSNESGQGSAPIAHAAAKTDEPVREGVVAMMGPMIDTLIICSITGLVILSTGVWHAHKPDSVRVNDQSAITVVNESAEILTDGVVLDADKFTGTVELLDGRPQDVFLVRNHSLVQLPVFTENDGTPFSGALTVTEGDIATDGLPALMLSGDMAQNGSPLTAWAFQEGLRPIMGNWGFLIITLGVVLFGVSTAISWSYYGDRAVVYLFGTGYILPYKIIFVVMHFLGAIFSLEIVWNFGDSALGLMSLPNLIALILLAPMVKRMTREYFSRGTQTDALIGEMDNMTPNTRMELADPVGPRMEKLARKGKLTAKNADLHWLYEQSVQTADIEVEFIDRVFREEFGRAPKFLREDFCGTALLCTEWAKVSGDHTALGVDLDGPTLDWGRVNNVATLGERAEAVTLIQDDVRAVTEPRADVLAATNFSWWGFKTRAELLEYLKVAHANLKDEGMMLMDCYGGPEAQVPQLEEREQDGFDYVWDQDTFNPITNEVVCKIHFKFPNGSKRKNAFIYDWRLWSLPETCDLLSEAGFRKMVIYWEGTDEDGEPNGVFEPSGEGDLAPAWVAYILAFR